MPPAERGGRPICGPRLLQAAASGAVVRSVIAAGSSARRPGPATGRLPRFRTRPRYRVETGIEAASVERRVELAP